MSSSLKLVLVIVIIAVLAFVGYRYIDKSTFSKAIDEDIIVVSIYPYELLVSQMVGDQVKVITMIPPNASPHTWTPLPKDIQALSEADLLISNGLGLEANLAKAFEQNSAKHVEIFSLLNKDLLGKEAEQKPHDHHHEADHEHGEFDPHLWTSAELLINIVNALSPVLMDRFPNKAEVIRQNSRDLIKDLMDADKIIMNEREAYSQPAIVTYHNSFHYFTRRYDIDYVGFVQASPGQEPSPKELNDLGKKIKAHKIKSIFIEPQMNPKSAEVLAKEFGIKLLTLDPMGNTLNVNTISEFLLKNWEIIKSGL